MPQVLIHPPSSFAEEHHRLKHQLIRHYAYRFRLQYNFMSNRLLDDLSYNFVTRLLDAEIPIDEVINLEVEDPVAYANHLEKTIKMAKGASLAFMKSFMSAAVEEAQDGKVLSEEWILIVKEKGITTATSRFANLLAEAIGNVSKHVAVARSFETATNPIVDPHSIRLIYGEEANNEIVEGGVLGGNIRNSNLKFHRIIHICSPDSDTLETQAMEDLLPDGAVDG
ncbi:MAG: hypothetical protein RL120_01780 [Gammaproteobacteria bacterium]